MAGWISNGLPTVPNTSLNSLGGTERVVVETNGESGIAPETMAATAFQLACLAAGLVQNSATATAGSATLNTFSGVVNTGALSTAAGSTASVKIVNSNAVTGAAVQMGIASGSNTTDGALLSAWTIATSGTITATITNNGAAAFNGSLLLPFQVGPSV